MCECGELGHEGRDEQVAIGMVDVLAVAFEGGVDLLLAEVERIGPVDVAILHECDVGVVAVVLLFEEAVVEAGVDHEEDVVEVQGMGDGVLVQQDLLLVLAQLLGDLVEVNDAVVYGLLVRVVLADPQALGDGLQAFLEVVHLEVDEGSR